MDDHYFSDQFSNEYYSDAEVTAMTALAKYMAGLISMVASAAKMDYDGDYSFSLKYDCEKKMIYMNADSDDSMPLNCQWAAKDVVALVKMLDENPEGDSGYQSLG